MSAVLVGVGASIFLLLGLGHAVFTFQSKPDGGPMMPTNPDTIAAMQVPGGIGLEPNLNQAMYQAWIGFNLSHSLGVVAAAAVVLVGAVDDFSASASNPWFVAFSMILPMVYLAIAVRFWFAKPRDGIAFGAALVWAGMIIELL